MGWWKADPVPEPPSAPLPPPSAQPRHPIPDSSSSAACPVDPQTRSLWLEQAAQQKKSQAAALQQQQQRQTDLPHSHPPITSYQSNYVPPQDCSSDRISQDPSSDLVYSTLSNPTRHALSHAREVSSIPRAQAPSTGPTNPKPSQSSALPTPANSEGETGTSTSGHWIYPSESQFFQAVMRKQSTTSTPDELAESVSAIIPIHNAVNERAWTLIKAWEGTSSVACGGPKLLSFKGLGGGALSPKARVKSFVGYTEPFDRHDWIVERCGGETVEYVIDFYQGKADSAAGKKGQQLNFYLDVRPKLNSVEGCRMRFEKFVGWR